jgi:hypothetical protein
MQEVLRGEAGGIPAERKPRGVLRLGDLPHQRKAPRFLGTEEQGPVGLPDRLGLRSLIQKAKIAVVEEVMPRDHLDKGVIDEFCGAAALHRDFPRRNREDQPPFTLANRLSWASSPRICTEGATPGGVRCSQPMMERQALPCIKVGSRHASCGRSGRAWA